MFVEGGTCGAKPAQGAACVPRNRVDTEWCGAREGKELYALSRWIQRTDLWEKGAQGLVDVAIAMEHRAAGGDHVVPSDLPPLPSVGTEQRRLWQVEGAKAHQAVVSGGDAIPKDGLEAEIAKVLNFGTRHRGKPQWDSADKVLNLLKAMTSHLGWAFGGSVPDGQHYHGWFAPEGFVLPPGAKEVEAQFTSWRRGLLSHAVSGAEVLLVPIRDHRSRWLLGFADCQQRHAAVLDPRGCLHPELTNGLVAWMRDDWGLVGPIQTWSFQPQFMGKETPPDEESSTAVHLVFNALMIMEGHRGAWCTPYIAEKGARGLWLLWDLDGEELDGRVARLRRVLRSVAVHAPKEHHLWLGLAERNARRLQRTLPATFPPPHVRNPSGGQGGGTVEDAIRKAEMDAQACANYLAPPPPGEWCIRKNASRTARVISWNIGPRHLDDQTMCELDRLLSENGPAVVFLQDANQSRRLRSHTLSRLKRAFPDYVPFLGGTDQPHPDHEYPFTLITLIRRSLKPATHVLTAKDLGIGAEGWKIDGGRYMGISLPVVPGVRGEVLLVNVYFPTGAFTDERRRVFELLTRTAELAVKRKAIVVAGGDFNAVVPGDAREGYSSGRLRQDERFAEWLGAPTEGRWWGYTAARGQSYLCPTGLRSSAFRGKVSRAANGSVRCTRVFSRAYSGRTMPPLKPCSHRPPCRNTGRVSGRITAGHAWTLTSGMHAHGPRRSKRPWRHGPPRGTGRRVHWTASRLWGRPCGSSLRRLRRR